MEKKIIKAEEVFEIIDSSAMFLYKDMDGLIHWASSEPIVSGDCWVFTVYDNGNNNQYGKLGDIEIKEFKNLDWKDCLYQRGFGIKARNLTEEVKLLREQVKDLENENNKLKQENRDLKNELDFYKIFKNLCNDWMTYPKRQI